MIFNFDHGGECHTLDSGVDLHVNNSMWVLRVCTHTYMVKPRLLTRFG